MAQINAIERHTNIFTYVYNCYNNLGFRQNNLLFPDASYKRASFIHLRNLVNLTNIVLY